MLDNTGYETTPIPNGPLYAKQTLRHLCIARNDSIMFNDRFGTGIHMDPFEGSSNVGVGYMRACWDLLNDNLLLDSKERSLWARDLPDPMSGSRGLGWHPVGSIEAEYGVPKKSYEANWMLQLKVEARKKPLRLQLGVKFRNCAFLRLNGTVQAVPDEDPLFDQPYAIEIDDSYSHEKSIEASHMLEPLCADNGSWHNLMRMFATPVLEQYKHLSYILYGRGGNGKSILLNALGRQFPALAVDVDAAQLVSGKGFDRLQAALPLASALWAFDQDADSFDASGLSLLKKVSTGDRVTARRIGENEFGFNTRATLIIATNNAVALGSGAASDRRMGLVRMRDGRKPEEFRELLDWLGEYGLSRAMMASCDEWLLGGDEPDKSVAIGDSENMTDAQAEIVDAICRFGYAETGKLAEYESNYERAKTKALLGLKSRSWRVGGSSVRVLVVADDVKFRPYRDAWNAENAELAEEDKTVEPVDLPHRSPAAQNVLPDQVGFACDYVPAEDKVAKGWKTLAADPDADTSHRPDAASYGVVPKRGYIVLDMDAGHDGETSGWAALQKAVGAYGTLMFPKTLLVGTPSGGAHAYYRLPAALIGHVKDLVRVGGVPVDVRCDGQGYVIGPGSKTNKGSYNVLTLPPSGTVPELSEQLCQWLIAGNAVEGVRPLPAQTPAASTLPSASQLMRTASIQADMPREAWVPGRLGRIDMSPIPEGSRNEVLHRQAFGLLLNHPDERQRILQAMYERGMGSGLSEAEVTGIIRSCDRAIGGRQAA